MDPTKRQRIPAAAILAGGISQHGSACYCRYCRESRTDAGVIQPPIPPRELVSVGGDWSPAHHVRAAS